MRARFPLEEMKYLYFYFFIYIYILISFSLISRQNSVLNFAVQHTLPPEFSGNGEWSVLTLGSLCLLCCVWDTDWKKIFINPYFLKKKRTLMRSLWCPSVYLSACLSRAFISGTLGDIKLKFKPYLRSLKKSYFYI